MARHGDGEHPAMLAPELDKQIGSSQFFQICSNSALPNSFGGARVLAEDSLVQTVDLTSRGVKRERPALGMQLQDGEILKRQCSTVLGGLQETVVQAVLKAGEEWNATSLAFIKTQEEFLEKIDAGKRREDLLLEEKKDLIKKLHALMETEALLYEERQKLISEIEAREETEEMHLKERKNLINKIDVLKESETELLREHQKVLDEFDARKERLTQRLQEVDNRKKRETALLQERQELLNEIRARKKREKALLLEHQEVINKIRAQKKRNNSKNRARNSKKTISILRGVTQEVLALAMEVEESQLVNKIEGPMLITSPKTPPCLEVPSTVASSIEESEKMINRAKKALTESAKKLKKNQDGVETMISYCREGILDRILGRKKLASETQAALGDNSDRDSDETQTMEQQRQMEQNSLTLLELKESEAQIKVPRTRMKPQRFRTSP